MPFGGDVADVGSQTDSRGTLGGSQSKVCEGNRREAEAAWNVGSAVFVKQTRSDRVQLCKAETWSTCIEACSTLPLPVCQSVSKLVASLLFDGCGVV